MATTKVHKHHNVPALIATLRSQKCVSCGECGTCISLLTGERVCQPCVYNSPMLFHITWNEASHTFGLNWTGLSKLPELLPHKGKRTAVSVAHAKRATFEPPGSLQAAIAQKLVENLDEKLEKKFREICLNPRLWTVTRNEKKDFAEAIRKCAPYI